MGSTVRHSPQDLIDAAHLGRKLKPSERLQVVVHLEKEGEIKKYTERDLAKLLGCSIANLRKYRQQTREMMAAAISADEAMNYMADFVRAYDILLKRAEEGLNAAKPNTGLHQGYLRIIAELWDNKINKLQSVGVIPKELGRLTSLKEEWIAEASPEGIISVRPHESSEDEA